jgi:hypothetical protein
MNTEVLVTKLVESFDDLDRCISMTKVVLSQRAGVPEDVHQRIAQYADIVNKQRLLTEDLKNFLKDENWAEVTRHVKLINGLSSMIRDDAQAILAGAGTVSERTKEELLA